MFRALKPIILVAIMIAPVVYYFEVERNGSWDMTHIKEWVAENFAGTTGYR
ncbi:MAG: hypothetical protein P8H03_03465 [Emcibacteraceae bacterium]|nr:hypothetical protein [Emcibacteraceae bacterium]